MFEEIRTVDIVLFIFGFALGTGLSYCISKLVFNRFFKKRADSITVESTASFKALQQVISPALRFIIGGMMIAPQLLAPVFTAWPAFQTLLAHRIFSFDSPIHGLTFAGIDTLADTSIGAIFGQGASSLSFSLVNMASAPV